MADSIDAIVWKCLDEIKAILPQYTEAEVEKATRRCNEENANLRSLLNDMLIKVVALYTASAPGGNYDVGNRFADADPDVQAARAALRKAGGNANG